MTSVSIDRLSVRNRPAGSPLLRQDWHQLVFLHWRVPPDVMRAAVPASLELDTFDDSAWIGMTPFRVAGMRPPFLPSIPVLGDSLELNVRTYVHRDGIPGVMFFSLDASNPLAVWGARTAFALPYYLARMELTHEHERLRFRSRRTHPKSARAGIDVAWEPGDLLPAAIPGTLEFFLVERYVLYVVDGARTYRARIHHRPWTLRSARLAELSSTMLEAQGLPTPPGLPLLHAQSAPMSVDVWARTRA